LDGEAGYCLTNLEAAITFLETVDLATLLVVNTSENGETSDTSETKEKIKPSQAVQEATNSTNELKITKSRASSSVSNTSATGISSGTGDMRAHEKAGAASNPIITSNKRLSYLGPVEFAASAATSAVSSADQTVKTIGSTLDTSFKFFLGRMSDRKAELPKTLDDARKLVGTPIGEKGDNSFMPSKSFFDSKKVGDGTNGSDKSTTPSTAPTSVPMNIFSASLQRMGSSESLNSKPMPLVQTSAPTTRSGESDMSQMKPSSLTDAFNPVGSAAESVRNL